MIAELIIMNRVPRNREGNFYFWERCMDGMASTIAVVRSQDSDGSVQVYPNVEGVPKNYGYEREWFAVLKRRR